MDTQAFDKWNDRTTYLQNKHGFTGVSAYSRRYAKKTRPEINPKNKPIPFPQSNCRFPNGTLKGRYEGTTIQGTHVFSKVKETRERKGFVNADGLRIDLRSVKWLYRMEGEV